MFVGFNLGFFPTHISGLMGMTRRVYTYPAEIGIGTLNLLSTVGAYLFAIGVAVVVSISASRHAASARRGILGMRARLNGWHVRSKTTGASARSRWSTAVIRSGTSRIS